VGGVREVGEKGAGSGIPKVVGSGRNKGTILKQNKGYVSVKIMNVLESVISHQLQRVRISTY